jgi:hypothetical protein
MLDDLDVLHSVPSMADALIHTAFQSHFSKLAENAEQSGALLRRLEALWSWRARTARFSPLRA